MAELNAQQRQDLKDGEFAYIDGQGGRHLPINDAAHVRDAASRFSQTKFEDEVAKHRAAQRIVAAAKRRGIDLDAHDDVVRVAG